MSNLATVYRDAGKPRLEHAWYLRAADMGDGDGLVDLAIRYLTGKGTRRNPAMAARLLARALRSGSITKASRDMARRLRWGLR